MGTYARWQMMLGKTFVQGFAVTRRCDEIRAPRPRHHHSPTRRRQSTKSGKPGRSGICKVRHGLARWNTDIYEAAATPPPVRATDQNANFTPPRCRTMVLTGAKPQ